MSRLQEKYKKEIIPELQQELSITNKMAVPRLEKIVINIGVGEAIQNIKALDTAKKELSPNSSLKFEFAYSYFFKYVPLILSYALQVHFRSVKSSTLLLQGNCQGQLPEGHAQNSPQKRAGYHKEI